MLGHPIKIWRRYHGHSPHLVWHIWWRWVWIGGEYADGYICEYEGVHAGVFGINWTIFQANLFCLTSLDEMFAFVCLLMVGEWGHFACQLRGPALLLSYLDNSWPKVGLALINRPSAFAEFYFPAPILGRCDLKVRSCYYLWTPPYYPLEQSRPFNGDSDHQRCPVRPSAMRRTEDWAWSPSCTRPQRWWIWWGSFGNDFPKTDFCVFIESPRVTDDDALAFVLIGHIRPNQDFISSKSIMFIRKGCLLTYISCKFNRSSLMADCTCRQNTLHPLVAWDNELCHLQ